LGAGFVTGENRPALDYAESTTKGVLDATKGLSDVLAVQTRDVKADEPYLPKE
jgi:hypothetical protein